MSAAGIWRFAACPHCGAEYPDFHSPEGGLGTLCDVCGWSSEEDVPDAEAAETDSDEQL